MKAYHLCDQCGKEFTRNNVMLQHRKKHSEEIVYKCDHCGQEFSKTCALYYHIRQCTGGEDKQESTQAITSSNHAL
jgi:KRAB domain-containing zinc finger protein